MFQSFMKHSYKVYLLELKDGSYEPTTRGICFAFDAKNPDPNQRWEWDDSKDRTYAIRLLADESGKQRGQKFDAERKARERNRDYFTGCMAFGTKSCRKTCADCLDAALCKRPKSRKTNGFSCHGKCAECPDYLTRTIGLMAKATDEDGNEDEVEVSGIPRVDNEPYECVESEAKDAALAAFLSSLTPTERVIWDCDVANMKAPRTYTDAQIAILIGKKQRKDVYNARQKLYAKIRNNPTLRDFFGR